jgi:hypothetical protein
MKNRVRTAVRVGLAFTAFLVLCGTAAAQDNKVKA